MDKKTKMILNLIQDDGDSFAKRAEMFYKRRPDLIKLVQDLHNSYCSLAKKYDQLRSECIHVAHLRSLPSSSLNFSEQVQPLENCNEENVESAKLEATTSHPDSVAEEHYSPEAPNVLLSGEQSNDGRMKPDTDGKVEEKGMEKIINGNEFNAENGGDYQMDSQEKEKMRNQLRLKVTTLIEDNLQQQTELIRRNEEKREVIKQLRSHINRLVEENRALKSYLPSYKVDMKRSQPRVSKLKGLNCIGKFQG